MRELALSIGASVGVGAALIAVLRANFIPPQKTSAIAADQDGYETLLDALNQAEQEFNQSQKEYERAAKEDPRLAVGNRFLEFARKNAQDPLAIDALLLVSTNRAFVFRPHAERAMNLLVKDHLQSERLAAVCEQVSTAYGGPFKPLEDMLRTVLAGSPHRDVQGWACFALGVDLTRAKEKYEAAMLRSSWPSPPQPEPKPDVTEADLKRLAAEASSLFERVRTQYADITGSTGRYDGPLGEVAERELFELRNLAVGQQAPEIEGEDVDGVPFKLSDYRGKVVLLEFWGNG